MRLSLRTKVFLPLLILMALLIGYLYRHWMPQSIANMERQYKEATERHLDSVVEGVVPLLLGRQLDNIYENFDALMKKNRDWISIRLTDATGRSLYPLGNVPAPESAAQAQNIRVLTKQITYLDMHLGTLTVAVDFSPHLAEWKREFYDAVSVMLAVIAVTVLSIGFVLERKVIQPVKKLELAAQDLAQGRFSELQLKAGDDEMGHLVDAFNSMREKLATSYGLLRQSEQRNRAITTTANDAIIMMDENGQISIWNPAAENIFGYTAEEVLGRNLHSMIVPDRYIADYERGLHHFNNTGTGTAVGKTIELTARKKDGTEFPAELSLSALQMNGKWHAVGMVKDITKRKSAEASILASLEEKKLLLREIHHRVKNNMQIISSLLDLQLEYAQGKQPCELFSEIKNRITSMSLVHEKLYLSGDLSRIDFYNYLSSLISNLYRLYNVNMSNVTLHLDVKNIEFTIDTAIPCGLIVNELITNSLKYAFPKGRAGEVRVTLRNTGKGDDGKETYELTVKDNGIGIPKDLALTEVKTLGLYLVRLLAEHQLDGTIDLSREQGTEFVIRFKEIKYRKRV